MVLPLRLSVPGKGKGERFESRPWPRVWKRPRSMYSAQRGTNILSGTVFLDVLGHLQYGGGPNSVLFPVQELKQFPMGLQGNIHGVFPAYPVEQEDEHGSVFDG